MPERIPIAERWATDEWPADAWEKSVGAETPDSEPGLLRVRMADLKGEIVEDGGTKALYREQEHPRDPIGRWIGKGLPDLPSPADVVTPIDDADKNTMSSYCGRTASFELNTYLRSGELPPADEVDPIELQLTEKHVDEQMAKHGTLAAQGARDGVKVKRLEGDLAKVLDDPDLEDHPDDWVGKSFVEKGYSSTTTNIESIGYLQSGATPAGQNATWILNVSPKVRAIWGANPKEHELVIDRNVRYTITAIKQLGPTDDYWQNFEIEATVEPADTADTTSAMEASVWRESEHPRDPKGRFRGIGNWLDVGSGGEGDLLNYLGKTGADMTPEQRRAVIRGNDWHHPKLDTEDATVELSDSLRPTGGSQTKTLNRSVNAIAAVHRVGNKMTDMPVRLGVDQATMNRTGDRSNDGGGHIEGTKDLGGTSLIQDDPYGKTGFDGVEPLSLSLTEDFDNDAQAEATIVHEIGHALDSGPLGAAIGAKQYASEMSDGGHFPEKMQPVMDALVASLPIQEFLDMLDNPKAPSDIKAYSEYASSPHEAFARAYSQWIALRAKTFGQTPEQREVGAEMLKSLQEATTESKSRAPEQWTDEQFKPIAAAFDELFKSIGWSSR
jgi:hypothetical protein